MLNPKMNLNLVRLLLESTNLTLAVIHETGPYCANCFFIFDTGTNSVILKSDMNTKHMQMALKDDRVAGTILPDKLETNRIRGIQFRGRISMPIGSELVKVSAIYHQKYPYATTMSGNMWVIEPTYFKLTDNSLGAGNKPEWGNVFE